MADLPASRPAGKTPATTGQRQQPGSIDYTPADAVGFDQMPRAVVNALAGVLLGPPVAADAEPPVTKRQADGTYYQQAKGWWAGGDRYVTIDARRLLAPAEGQSLRPITGWKIDGIVSHFVAGIIPVNSVWRFDPGGGTEAGKGRRPNTDDPLDVLPEPLTAPVRGADVSAWREHGRGWAEETIVAPLVSPERILILKVQRKATSRRVLQTADWHAVTVDAAVSAIQALATDQTGRVLLGPAASPTQIGHSSQASGSIGPPKG
jgi:hypothetical protein